ncbi:endonuclease/exonuclease/phosphatase family protein [Streptomyces sp. NPDC048717]|uniref:endonuclease/exonuclease/phosphatase family protein n=1 Tax=Streptomyces sp. NPDC048717 TaxID=3154928 RepID=UPI00342530A1
MRHPYQDPHPDVYIGGGFSDPDDRGPDDRGPGEHPSDAPGLDTDPDADPDPEPDPEPEPNSGSGSGSGRRYRVPGGVAAAVVTGLVLLCHSFVPNTPGNLGSLLDTVLPWTGLAVPVLLLLAVFRGSVPGGVAALALGAVWSASFAPLFLADHGGSAPDPNLTVVTHNVGAANPDPAGTARSLLAADPDLVALEEITDETLPAYRKTLDRRLPHSARVGTVALWSRFPIDESRRVTIDPGWSRSLRALVRGPKGPVAVYVVHLPSVRVGASGFTTGRRDNHLTALASALDHERQRKILLLGDLNGTTADRAFAPLLSRLTPASDASGAGFGFSWPAAFPLARLDHILTRGVTPTDAWTLPATGSDHRPVAARLRA